MENSLLKHAILCLPLDGVLDRNGNNYSFLNSLGVNSSRSELLLETGVVKLLSHLLLSLSICRLEQ